MFFNLTDHQNKDQNEDQKEDQKEDQEEDDKQSIDIYLHSIEV